MYRKIYKYLSRWKDDKYRKPLIIQGARQVGKTYSMLEFGKNNYENVAYFNFQTDPVLSETFSESIHPDYLLPLLGRIAKTVIIPEKTLIILDEIQLCERALTCLKYFYEEKPEYHIIAAGSLLGVAVNRKEYAFPVGKIDRYTMYPMDMEEFLLAYGEEDLVKMIETAFYSDKSLPEVLHHDAIELYKKYLITGGMPEAVARLIETYDFLQVRHVQDSLLMDYLDDMSKYQNNVNEIKKTRLTYHIVSVQLSKKNTRFQYKLLKTGGRAAEFENAIEWLVMSGMVSQVYRCEQIMKPLENYIDIDDFKIYLSDTGLLCAQKDVSVDDILYMNVEINDFKGGLTENYVNSQLITNGIKTYFWKNEKGTSEVDFIVNLGGKIIPLEVKSGDNVSSASLKEYIKRFSPEYAVRISTKNFGMENGIKSIPLYATFMLGRL
ncbi:MAG: AAA family ATPase [Lachnospiraceae bacterium]|nr:AAA family ATPase [Lachnospiraceae bacterium]